MPRSPHRSALVGREAELAALVERLTDAGRGAGGVALVTGEPGIGKTRVLSELAERARADGWRVLIGHAYDTEGMPPYLPFIEALRGALRDGSPAVLRAQLGDGAGAVARLLPELHRVLPDVPASPAVDPEQDRYRLFEGVCDALEGIARAGEPGLLLTLDDLHWADAPSLQLLQHLSRRLAGVPTLVVAAYRSVDAAPSAVFTATLAALARTVAAAPLTLAPLGLDATRALATSIVGHEVAAPVATTIQQATAGNPFFVGELVRHLWAEGRDLADPDAASDGWAIPELVRQVVAARLARLRPPTNELLRHGAVLGDGFAFAVVRVASRLDEDAALDAVEEALAAGILRAAGDTFHFAHALIRRTLYDALSSPRRQRLHLRAAAAIEAVYAPHLAPYLSVLTNHYRLAGSTADPNTVIDYALRAGEAAQAIVAWEDAATHWSHALRLMEERGAEPGRRADVLERLGDLLYLTDSDRTVGITYLERALTLDEALGREDKVAQLHTRIGRFISSTPFIRNVPRILAHYGAAEAILRRAPDEASLGSLSVAMASTALSAVRTEEGVAASQRAMEIAERLGDAALWADAARTHGAHLAYRGQLADGVAFLGRAWEAADRLDHAIVGYWATIHHALLVRRHLLDPADAVRWYERELAKPRLAQAPHLRAQMTANLGDALICAGRLTDARALALSYGYGVGAENALALAAGDWDDAGRLWADALERARRAGDRNNTDWNATGLAQVLRARGDLGDAEPLLREALAIGVDGPRLPTEVAARAALALLCAETGRAEEAQSHLARCRAVMAGGEDWRGQAGRIALAEAVVAAALGQTAATERPFEEALAAFRRYLLPWDEAEALTYWGRALLGAGRRAPAAARIAAADALYQRLGAGAPWRERLSQLQQQPIPAGKTPAAYPNGLSAREVEVLRLIAAGRSNREISAALVISVNTVERHVNHILQKTGTANRAQAVTYAHQHGLV